MRQQSTAAEVIRPGGGTAEIPPADEELADDGARRSPIAEAAGEPANWPAAWRHKLTTAEAALKAVHSGQRVYLGGGCGEPLVLAQSLAGRAAELTNVEIIQILTAGHAAYADPALAAAFRVNALFIGANVRDAVQAGQADFTPVFLSEIPRLFQEGHLPLDVALIAVSPPDTHGYCSFGVEVGVTKPAAESARLVIAEINPNMPRTWGNSFIHLSQIDACVSVDYPLPELPPSTPTPLYRQIGQTIAELIPDGATLQMGIGAIPNAVLDYLSDKHDLGVHSEMISDGIIDLVEQGVITGRRKSYLPGKIVTGFMLGTRRLYRFVHDNPLIEMRTTDYTNDPFIISRNDQMVAINAALQVDLTGQICADSIGPRFYSGVGGQVDFLRGAGRARGGKPIIALPSTALNGTRSRLVATLDPGAGVTATRNDVHYVITEYGVAQLYGKSVRQRAEALIAIAHPDFRPELRAAARARHLL